MKLTITTLVIVEGSYIQGPVIEINRNRAYLSPIP